MKIYLRDTIGKSFVLSSVRASDDGFFSTRRETAYAIQRVNEDPEYAQDLTIYRKPTSPDTYSRQADVTVRMLLDGTIRMGCHDFSPRNTRRLLRWAGVKI